MAGVRALDWKPRSERLVRLSGAPYTIVRPGWLDNGPASAHVTIEQGDTGDGSIAREVLAHVHIEALLRESAIGKTFEVFSEPGETTSDWDSLFGATQPDASAIKPGAQHKAEPSTPSKMQPTCRSKTSRT